MLLSFYASCLCVHKTSTFSAFSDNLICWCEKTSMRFWGSHVTDHENMWILGCDSWYHITKRVVLTETSTVING